MEKSKLQDKALDISHKIIKEKYGIVENPGIVSEEDLEREGNEFDPKMFESTSSEAGDE